MKKPRILIVAALSGLSFVSSAGATTFVTNLVYPGSTCTFYSGTASTDNRLTQSGGNAAIHNIASSTTKAQCTATHDELKESFAWSMVTDTAGWANTSCSPIWYDDLSENSFTYPTSVVKSDVPASGRTKFHGDTQYSFGGFSGPIVLGCVMPANSTLYTFNIFEETVQ